MRPFGTVSVLSLTTVFFLHSAACFSVPPAERSFTSNPAGNKRGVFGPPGLPKFGSDDGSSVYAGKFPTSPSNPMNPFLSLRPFLPAKPTFFPPVVDPNTFINNKAQMLNTLFSSSALSSSASDSGIPETADSSTSDSALPDTAPINPNVFIDKKTAFLNKLFGQISSNDPSLVQRSLLSAPPPLGGPVLSPTEKLKFYSDKKTEFLNTLFNSISATPQPETDSVGIVGGAGTTAKPTIVPPSFWVPDYKQPTIVGERALSDSVQRRIAPQMGPSWYPLAPPTAKPTIVPPSFWIPDYMKPVMMDERALIDTAQQQQLGPQPAPLWNPMVPPMAKAFSDKKTAFLNQLFSSVISSPGTSAQAGSTFDTVSPTVKPTIVPPNFWLPSYKKPSGTAENIGIQNPPSPATSESDSFVAYPFAPLVKGVPVVSPTYFITKKNEFLTKLFQSLNTTSSTPAPYSPTDADADTYSYFIDQLVNYLNGTNTEMEKSNAYSSPKRHSPDSDRIRVSDLKKILKIINDNYDTTDDTATNIFNERSVTTTDLVNPYVSAKDTFVQNILAELVNVKNSMLQAASDLVQQQKTAATTASVSSPGKKSGSAYGSPYKTWGKAVPTADPIQPFVTKMTYLNQLFDTLTQLEKNMTSAIDQEVKQGSVATSSIQKGTTNEFMSNSRRALNTGATNSNLAALKLCGDYGELAPTELSSLTNEPDSVNDLTTEALLDKSKKLYCHLLAKAQAGEGSGITSADPVARSIKMAVHQGYQSLPPGTEEILQAGGGGEAQSQEGGGLKLQIKVPA